MLRTHPPDLALEQALASNGEKIVPALIDRLVSVDRDLAKLHLVGVFYNMQVDGYYDVVSHAATMKALEEQASSIVDPGVREGYLARLDRMRLAKTLIDR